MSLRSAHHRAISQATPMTRTAATKHPMEAAPSAWRRTHGVVGAGAAAFAAFMQLFMKSRRASPGCAKLCQDLQMRQSARQRIGLISDTHGLLRPEALAFLRGCSAIVHGGDIGGSKILDDLRCIAPVTAVRGNNDDAKLAEPLRYTELIRINRVLVFVIHDLSTMDIDPRIEGIRVVVSGHSHKPLVVEREGVLFVNPGSAGPRRFKLPIAMGELTIVGSNVSARIVDLGSLALGR
jgi:putative phosphoesterase